MGKRWPDEAFVFEWTGDNQYVITNYDLFSGAIVELLDPEKRGMSVRDVEGTNSLYWLIRGPSLRRLRPLTPAARDMLALVRR